MKTLIPLLTALLCTSAALADVARPVLQSSTTKALVDDLATGAKKMSISSTGTLEWVNGGTFTGASYFRTAAGLGSVENTALSTWAGTANVTTLGTITTGTWHGSAVGIAYGGTGATTAAAARTALGLGSLAVQSDASVAISGGSITGLATFGILNSGTGAFNFQINHVGTLTAGHTLSYNLNNGDRSISLGGNLTVSGDASVSGTNTGDQTLTSLLPTQSGHAGEYLTTNGTTASWGAVSSGITIGTTAISGGTSGRLLWDNTGKVDEVSGSSVSGADLYLQSSHVKIGDGIILLGSSLNCGIRESSSSLQFYSQGGMPMAIFTGYINIGTNSIGWGTNVPAGATDAVLGRLDTGHLMAHSFTSPQNFSVMLTYSSSTNYEAFVIDNKTTANVCRIGTDVGSGGGTARDVQFVRGGVVKATIGANTTDHAQPVKLPSYIVSGLPSASTCGAGSMAFVTDATATTAYTTVAGGGSNKVLVISDGTNWVIH